MRTIPPRVLTPILDRPPAYLWQKRQFRSRALSPNNKVTQLPPQAFGGIIMSLFVGIDWADESCDVHITDEVGKSLSAFSIENSLLGRDTFINFDLWRRTQRSSHRY